MQDGQLEYRESPAILQFPQLRAAASKIPLEEIQQIARQLELTDDDLDEVKYGLQEHPLDLPGEEKRLRILEAWKRKDPHNCTLENLTTALEELNLNRTAREVTAAVNGNNDHNQMLEEDANCGCQWPITMKMIHELSTTVPGKIYTSLGFELGLTREQMCNVGAKCKQYKNLSDYIYEMLKTWMEIDNTDAIVGKLYTALRLIEYNDIANKVFKKCEEITGQVNLM